MIYDFYEEVLHFISQKLYIWSNKLKKRRQLFHRKRRFESRYKQPFCIHCDSRIRSQLAGGSEKRLVLKIDKHISIFKFGLSDNPDCIVYPVYCSKENRIRTYYTKEMVDNVAKRSV